MELWKDIKDFENYEVSTFGNVRNKTSGLILKSSINKKGYLQVYPSKNSQKKTIQVHKLVVCAFIENPNNLPQIDHIDRNQLNNNIENLRWITCQHNNWNRTTKNISIRENGNYRVYYTIENGKAINKSNFKTEQEAKDYLEEIKIKYPRIII